MRRDRVYNETARQRQIRRFIRLNPTQRMSRVAEASKRSNWLYYSEHKYFAALEFATFTPRWTKVGYKAR